MSSLTASIVNEFRIIKAVCKSCFFINSQKTHIIISTGNYKMYSVFNCQSDLLYQYLI